MDFSCPPSPRLKIWSQFLAYCVLAIIHSALEVCMYQAEHSWEVIRVGRANPWVETASIQAFWGISCNWFVTFGVPFMSNSDFMMGSYRSSGVLIQCSFSKVQWVLLHWGVEKNLKIAPAFPLHSFPLPHSDKGIRMATSLLFQSDPRPASLSLVSFRRQAHFANCRGIWVSRYS